MIDLTTPLQIAVFQALKAGVTLADVYDVVPQGAKPSFVKIGQIALAPEGSKGAQYDRFEVEVHVIYRGKDRSELVAIMHEVRVALDGAALTADGVDLSEPEMIDGAISDAASDGVTYAGISIFEIFAEPA